MSAETSSKVQLQLILVSETQLNFHFTGDRENALTQRNKCKTILQRMLQQVMSQISCCVFNISSPVGPQAPPDPDLQAKSSLLNSTPGLHQLYRELVVGGMITAEEFWDQRLVRTCSNDAPLTATSPPPSP